LDQRKITDFFEQKSLHGQDLARAFNLILEQSAEKGVPPCPECFAVGAVPDGFMNFKRLPGVKVKLFTCKFCWRRFREDWLPIKSHGLAEQVCLILTMVECGAGVSDISKALRSLSRELGWIVPLSKSSVLRIIQLTSEVLRGMERQLFRGLECEKIVAFTVKRRRAGGSFHIALAVDERSACWLEAKPLFNKSANTFAEELARKVKPRKIAVSPVLAEAIKRAFPDSSIHVLESELISEGRRAVVPIVKRAKRVVKKNTSYFSEESVDALLTITRAHYNFLGKKNPPARSIGISLPRLLRGWRDLLRYAAYVQKLGKQT